MTDAVDNLPPTQYLILDVLAARYRCGEPYWTFPRRLKPHLDKLVATGLVEVIGSTPDGWRVQLTGEGQNETLSLTYQLPVPTLATAISTLPSKDEHYLSWMRKHGLGHGAGIATVISAVRADLQRLMGGDRRG